MTIGHVGITVADLNASKAFYLTALAPLGYVVRMEIDNVVVGLGVESGAIDFWIQQSPKTDSATAPAKVHIAFCAASREVVDAFHSGALSAGAKSNGEPGERPQYSKGYYAAYAFDLDGNNIEAMYFQPS